MDYPFSGSQSLKEKIVLKKNMSPVSLMCSALQLQTRTTVLIELVIFWSYIGRFFLLLLFYN